MSASAWMELDLSYNTMLKPVQGMYRGLYRGRVISKSCPICGGWWISPCSASWAQWGEGRADKVIYLHPSTSCNGWHIHLSLKLHHLTAAPPSHGEAWERNETDMLHKKKKWKQTKQIVLFHTFSLRRVCGNMTLSSLKPLNHSPMSSTTKA